MLPCLRFGQWEPLQNNFHILLIYALVSLSTSLLSCMIRCSKLIVYFSRINPFSKNSKESFQWRLVIETQIWALILATVPQWAELEDTCVYHTHI